MNIKILVRTHDKTNVHDQNGRSRYCNENKTTVVIKCITSLINSVSYAANKLNGFNFSFVWIDDNSENQTIEVIADKFKEKNMHFNIIKLKNGGNNNSMLCQINAAKNITADLVYLVEDDYLHTETAIYEMILMYIKTKNEIHHEVAIHPFDDPDNYKRNFIEPSKIILGDLRHWRTNTYSTFTFLCNPIIINENWELFYKMAYLYMTPFGDACNIHEGTTINKVWRESVCLLTPIPSVALHMQYEEQKDKFIDWKKWWDDVK